MTQPHNLGDRATNIMAFIAERLRDNDGSSFDAAAYIVGDDKQAALHTLKAMSRNDNLAKDLIILLQSKRIQEAEDLIMAELERGRKVKALLNATNGNGRH